MTKLLSADTALAATERRYDLDWLRVGAFGLLIFYHIGMFYVSWDWHVKSAQLQPWIEPLMLITNPWRLSLLFLIGGAASWLMLRRMDAGRFMKQRTVRLLLPLIFGIVVIVPPQSWAEVVEKAGYSQGYAYFWLNDYFEFGASRGLILPTYNHLWFVAYAWVYALLLGLLAMTVPSAVAIRLRDGLARVLAGWRLLVVPVLFLLLCRMALFPAFGITHAFVDDWYNHAVSFAMFLFGAAYVSSATLDADVTRHWRAAAVMAVIGYAGVLAFNHFHDDVSDMGLLLVGRTLQAMQAWGAIVALLGMARCCWNRDGKLRRYLTSGIFPFYIAHQTIIVLAGFGLKPLNLPAGLEFLLILGLTTAGCFACYEIARRSAVLRPLFGLAPKSPTDRPRESKLSYQN